MINLALPRRRADIPPDLRKRFDKFGEDLMRVAIESGDSGLRNGGKVGDETAELFLRELELGPGARLTSAARTAQDGRRRVCATHIAAASAEAA